VPDCLAIPEEDGLPLLSTLVDGEWLAPTDPIDDISPAHPDRVVARVSRSPAAEARQAIDAAAGAATAWARRPAGERGAVLHRAATLLEERREGIGLDLAREEGKTLPEAIGETQRAADVLRFFAGQTLQPDGFTYPSARPTTTLSSRRVPLGVVSIISPWNFPIAIPAWKIAPALAYGNAVVWKPAEIVPLTATRLVAALADAGLPAGVLNMVLGKGSAVGDTLVTDTRVAGVSFTGSNGVGDQILRTGAAAGRRFQLELGGKNPAVVLADADIDHAVGVVSRAAFQSAGQKCTATSRVIAERPVYEELVEKLAAAADALRVGDPVEAGVDLGPLASGGQAETVRGYYEQADKEGRRVTRRGAEDMPGELYAAPGVYADLPEASPPAHEEVFGPMVCVTPADSYEEAVRQANATEYGLAATLFTRDLAAAHRFVEDSESGIVKINQETSGVEFQAPFGGFKASGHGPQEQGGAAAEFFNHWKTAYIDRVGR
jgi:alpha-ketoglutaric semialdehyde dehydrogenase